MSNNINLKKPSILNLNTFSFIANIAKKSLNQETSESDEASLSEFISLEIKTDTESETKETNFNLKNQDLQETNKIEIDFKLLSKSASNEYKTKENYLKGCKWYLFLKFFALQINFGSKISSLYFKVSPLSNAIRTNFCRVFDTAIIHYVFLRAKTEKLILFPKILSL